MKPVLLTLYSEGDLFYQIQKRLGCDYEIITPHEFPDKETSIKFESKLKGRDCIVFESLNQPNHKTVPLLFLAETARDLGAKQVGFVAPYLAYMRQDVRFHDGESITARYFSKLISKYFNWLITVDPHLHRIHNLNEVYTIPTSVVHAALNIADWIKAHVENPVIIGPDQESEQWAAEIAAQARVPYLVLEKVRRSDSDVSVAIPEFEKFQSHTPVLVDDIIATARTMIETMRNLKDKTQKAPICIGIHGVFANNAYEELLQAGAVKVVTCNTILHVTNEIDLSPGLVEEIQHYLEP